MTNPFKTKNFKKLQKTWYKKLAKSGFEDIEDNSFDEPMLKKWDAKYFAARYSDTAFIAKQEYYRIAEQWGNSYAFESIPDKRAWTMHAEGMSVRDIARKMRLGKNPVHDIIKRLREVCFGTDSKTLPAIG